jgi:hypothetical protein
MPKLPRFVPVEKLLQYNQSFQVYNQPTEIPVMDFCNGWTIYNGGTATVLWCGEPILPGIFKAMQGNRGEIYVGRLDLSFINTGAQTQQAYVTQKYYMNVPGENDADR